MKRETTNRLRFVLEDLIPPAIKDSILFLWIAKLFWGNHIVRLAEFRERAPFLTDTEYEDLYRSHPRVHNGTDNSDACIAQIIQDLRGTSICDIGCGTGQLLRIIDGRDPTDRLELTGLDLVLPEYRDNRIEYVASKMEALPFNDREFDTVICTHVLEHILDIRKALSELRRITRRRLIIVVPKERETRYTFNPHFHFFPYTHSFLRTAIPVPPSYYCVQISRDIYYREDADGSLE